LKRAVFLDRDGVINELVYYQEQEVIDSPFTPRQFQLIPGVTEALKTLSDNGYLTILVSNQPGIAKGNMTEKNFELIRQKMILELIKGGAVLDGEYYCLHHPKAVVAKYRVLCDCRKPLPGLLLKAAGEKDINLKQSWIIGDNLSDIQTGLSAGCRTILIGTMKCDLCRLISEKNTQPNRICSDLVEAVKYLSKES
jgi:D-glycero-D-manno-heptose 1,7-bisphosphate phosphatase